LQLDIDIGSSSVAKGVVNLVIGYVTKLVLEMAFLIQVYLIPIPFSVSRYINSDFRVIVNRTMKEHLKSVVLIHVIFDGYVSEMRLVPSVGSISFWLDYFELSSSLCLPQIR
jgi:hypothetical protein